MEIRVFTSTAHPGEAARSLTYTRWFGRPLAICMLPLMIAALVAALQGFPALPFLVFGAPTAFLVATAWTHHRMHITLAEVHVGEEAAAVFSVWDCTRPVRVIDWRPVLDLRHSRSSLTLTLGDTSYSLDAEAWPALDDLLADLKEARDCYFSRPHPLP